MEQEIKTPKGGLLALMAVIVVIIITLLALFATGTISLNTKKVENDNKVSEPTNTIDNQVEENTKTEEVVESKTEENTNWVDYLLTRNISETKITRLRNIELGDSETYNNSVILTEEELKEILTELKNKKLTKVWSQGRGGPNRDHLVVSYESNDHPYEFEIINGSISVDKLDHELIGILDNNKYEEKNTEVKDLPGTFYFYSIGDYTETMFDKYCN
ncbi:MAG: hypothetical protein IKI04_03240 [Bacilli bacterium]|nr:hypothetical protein [Bacilli bacterium]